MNGSLIFGKGWQYQHRHVTYRRILRRVAYQYQDQIRQATGWKKFWIRIKIWYEIEKIYGSIIS
ncbi:hypothetical protein LX87_02203 [Larkinella arboricola]|uniref:Uncharacterized protein n=1 Tax=Larkinella arboricola TaxID=643671 RepID=A0A327X286_LARAB|nr:hypothetical protein [Larkinella arboricola]RAK00496.1 hypothetical protein LX87_02203 [Larkinella arboricola]